MKKTVKAAAPQVAFLSNAELADIYSRNAGANRLRATFGLGRPGESELERLVAEVRYWRKSARAASAPNP